MKRYKLNLALVLLLAATLLTAFIKTQSAPANDHENEPIEWLSIEEAAKRCEKKPRKIFIDVYTDWCGWCKKMDKSTFAHAEIAKYVNKHYYAVKLNAEDRSNIIFKDQVFKFNPEYRSNELAVALLQGQMSFPSTVYLDEKMNMIQAVPGYMDTKDFDRILHFFGEDHYKKTTWDDFQKSFKSKL